MIHYVEMLLAPEKKQTIEKEIRAAALWKSKSLERVKNIL